MADTSAEVHLPPHHRALFSQKFSIHKELICVLWPQCEIRKTFFLLLSLSFYLSVSVNVSVLVCVTHSRLASLLILPPTSEILSLSSSSFLDYGFLFCFPCCCCNQLLRPFWYNIFQPKIKIQSRRQNRGFFFFFNS